MALAVCCAVFSAVSAWEGNVCLNKSAVTDASGQLVVLGTEGSWNDNGDVKECVFDGNTGTFFDPPSLLQAASERTIVATSNSANSFFIIPS